MLLDLILFASKLHRNMYLIIELSQADKIGRSSRHPRALSLHMSSSRFPLPILTIPMSGMELACHMYRLLIRQDSALSHCPERRCTAHKYALTLAYLYAYRVASKSCHACSHSYAAHESKILPGEYLTLRAALLQSWQTRLRFGHRSPTILAISAPMATELCTLQKF